MCRPFRLSSRNDLDHTIGFRLPNNSLKPTRLAGGNAWVASLLASYRMRVPSPSRRAA